MYNRPKLGEILIEHGAAGSTEILLDSNVIRPAQLAKALAEQMDMDLIEEIIVDDIDLALLDFVPISYARSRNVLVLRREHGVVYAAISDPLDVDAIDHVARAMRAEVETVVCAAPIINDAVNLAYDRHDRLRGTYGGLIDDDEAEEVVDPGFEDVVDLLGADGDDEAPVIQFVNTTFVRAARDRASDIHIEPQEQRVLVRFRVDGVLSEVAEVPKRFHSSIVARVKIMANLNIAEKRLPQDGRIRIKLAGKDIDIRVATAPTTQGERVTMRLLDKSAVLLDLATIGMHEHTLSRVEDLVLRPHGILLVTGPTGSGKTTTLYSCLSRINHPDKNILTVEDPVEYQLEGISQLPVNSKIDLTFANGLRSFLRHDPDVIMVGEIRDQETAEIAIQASLTGHLVLSTIHTNDAAGAFTRLIDMGVEPFLVASSLLANMAQRLVRRLCKECRQAYDPTDAELEKLGVSRERLQAEANGHLYRPVGCEHCRDLGYRGRSGIYELLPVTDEIRQLVMSRTDASSIKRTAVAQGMRTLQMDGADKVLQGLTTIEEVFRVTQSEAA